METISNTQGSDGRSSERSSMLGNLAQRLQDATVLALGGSHAQCLVSDDAILSLDLEGTIATWNHGAAELFGYAADEIIGKPVTLLIPADREAEEPSILERVARGERIQHHETLRLAKGGRIVTVSLSVSPIEDAAGTVIGASEIVRDVTARKLIEAALAKRAEEQAALYEFTDRLSRARSANDAVQAGGTDDGARLRRGVDDLRCPSINGLPADVIHLLHHSLTHLVFLRRGLDVTRIHVQRAKDAALESQDLLARLRAQGF